MKIGTNEKRSFTGQHVKYTAERMMTILPNLVDRVLDLLSEQPGARTEAILAQNRYGSTHLLHDGRVSHIRPNTPVIFEHVTCMGTLHGVTSCDICTENDGCRIFHETDVPLLAEQNAKARV